MAMRLLLDVDGVINAVTGLPGKHWNKWNVNIAFPWEGVEFYITHADEVAEFLCEIHQSGIEIIWLTTWGVRANEQISPLVGLPTNLKVAGEVPYRQVPYSEKYGWWKLVLARELYESDGTPFIWIDDDLRWEQDAKEWLGTLPNGSFLAIGPETAQGIHPRHIEKIRQFIESHKENNGS